MSDKVGFPVEGLGTLVTLVFPLLRVGQSVGLQTAGRTDTDVQKSDFEKVVFLSRICLSDSGSFTKASGKNLPNEMYVL